MSTVIPSTLDEVKEHLNGLGKLVTAKEWERAAIVWAWTAPREFGANQYTQGVNSDTLSFSAFAALDIVGLRSKNSVAHYHSRWQAIVDKYGDEYAVRPGDEIPAVADPWREERSRDESSGESTSSSAPQPSAEDVVAAIRNNPEVAQQVAADADARAEIARAAFEVDGEREERAQLTDERRRAETEDAASLRIAEALRRIKNDVSAINAQLEHVQLTAADRRAALTDTRVAVGELQLIESKLTDRFESDLELLLSEGEGR